MGGSSKSVTFDDGTSIVPKTTATSSTGLDIGSNSKKFKDIYLAGVLSDGTNSIAVADIAAIDDIPTKLSDLNDDLGVVTDVKYLNTTNTTAQTAVANEAIEGSGTINLHKISKTGSYTDLLNKPTIGDAILTLTQNSASLGTFTANATTDVSIDIVTPQVYRYI